MKKSNRFFALCLAMTMVATMAMTGALSETTQNSTSASAEATAAPVATHAPDEVLVTVNGEPVTYGKMQKTYEDLYYQYTSQGYDLTGQESVLQSIATEYSIQETIFRQKAAEYNLDQFTQDEETEFVNEAKTTWDSYLTQQAQSYITSDAPTDEEKAAARQQAEDSMAQYGYTEESLLEALVLNYKDQKIQERMIDLLTKDLPAITDEDVLAEYQTRVDADKESYGSDIAGYEYATNYYGQQVWYVPEGMRGITHILLKVDSALMDNFKAIQAQLEEQNDDTEATGELAATAAPDATAAPAPLTLEDLEAARTAILDSVKTQTDDIYTRLDAGEDFAALITEYGTDPGMTTEPNKTDGYSIHADSILYDPAFVKGSFGDEMQKVGDVSQPVVSSFGVHILSYTRDVPGGPVELTDDSKESLRQEMDQNRKNSTLPNAMQEWQDAAEITYTESAPSESGE